MGISYGNFKQQSPDMQYLQYNQNVNKGQPFSPSAS